MRATEVLQKCLGESLQTIHALRSGQNVRVRFSSIAPAFILLSWPPHATMLDLTLSRP